MNSVLVIDVSGGSHESLEQDLQKNGWAVIAVDDAAKARGIPADAIVLITDEGHLGHVLKEAQNARQNSGAPIILVTDLDRSGWDRTTEAGAISVDALFDLPLDSHAVTARLRGIFEAQHYARHTFVDSAMSEIVARAIANEEAAEAFYRRASQAVSQDSSREILESFMRDEAEHKRLLEEFRSGARALPDTPPPHTTIVEAFGSPDFSAGMSPADAFLLAANKEKLAVEMYETWAKLYPQGPERELLLRMSDIEKMHKARIESMFTNAAFPEVW